MIPVIGLCGRAGAGKTTASEIIQANYSQYSRVSFAEPLRKMLSVLGVTFSAMRDKKNEPHPALSGATPRRAMQLLGTEWGRQLHPNFWINQWVYKAARLLEDGLCVIVDDVRFENEVEVIHNLGGHVILITSEKPLPPTPVHASEVLPLDHVNIAVSNDFGPLFKARLLATINKLEEKME